MKTKILKLKSYNAFGSVDKSLILNIAGKVSLLKVAETDIAIIRELSVLKNPSSGVISPDLKTLAYKSTSGKIAVHDAETGELIIKHDAIKNEGCGLYFVHQNRKILSSTWACDVFLVDIHSGNMTKLQIGDGEYHGAAILPGLTEDEFYIYCINRNARRCSDEASTVFKLLVNTDSFECHPVCNLPECGILTPAKLQNALFFSSRSNINCLLYKFDLFSNTYSEYIDIQKVYNSSGAELRDEQVRVTYITGSADGKYLIVACNAGVNNSKIVMIINATTQKCLAKIEYRYVSNIMLLNSDRTLWVGTWEKIYVYDFLELIGESV